MGSRTSFRPRPLDTSRQLNIVRDVKELDDGEQKVSRDIVHSHEALDKDNEEARMVSSKQAKGGKEIPIPDVRMVSSYSVEYLPVHKEPRVYIRGKAGVGWHEEDEVDYDLDEQDRQWLIAFNKGQERLPYRRMELLLWRLDTANAEATDSAFASAGASIAERTSPAACATTDHMSREQAMEALTQVAAARQPVKDAVYRYWLDKRKQLGKPLLRRLQAPTNSSDTNPHSCFRAREKINKPLLRNRRRGNDMDSLQKLQTIRQNQLDAIKVVHFLIKRERKKRDIAYADVDLQQYQIKMKHEPRHLHDAIDAEYAAAVKLTAKGGRRPVGFDAKSEKAHREAEGAATPDAMAALVRKSKKRRRDPSRMQSISALPPPPLPTEPEMLFANPVSLARFSQPASDSQAMPPLPDFSTCRARIGRGGRLVLARCQPFSHEPLEAEPPIAEDIPRPPPFDMTAPYAAAEAQYQQELQNLQEQPPAKLPRHASPGVQAAKGMPMQPPQAVAGRPHAASQSPAADGSPSPQPSTSQSGLQQTRNQHQQQQQQQQQQQHPQLIEMPSQPGASVKGPSPPKSKVANGKKGTPAAAINGRTAPGTSKRGPGRPPKKQASTLSNGTGRGSSAMDFS
ncbi:hypothetical protein ABBQ38_009373 [Trebouxia sp. C0009 RCD-2024]